MSYQIDSPLGIFAGLLLVLFLAYDLLSMVSWRERYLMKGLLGFKAVVKETNFPFTERSAMLLFNNLDDGFIGKFAFSVVKPGHIAFRESFFHFSLIKYAPTMHFNIYYDSNKNHTVLEGRFLWYIFPFILLAYAAFLEYGLPAAIIFVIIFTISYGIQFSRIVKVVDVLKQRYPAKQC